jgi:DNA-binding GntR family transcriptional regulator
MEKDLIKSASVREATKAQVEKLKELIEMIPQGFRSPELRWDGYIPADSQFNLILARIAEGSIFGSVLTRIYDNFNRYFEQFPRKLLKLLREKVTNGRVRWSKSVSISPNVSCKGTQNQ